MDIQVVRSLLPTLVRQYLPANARRLDYRIYDGTPMTSMLGLPVDAKPFEGTVVSKTDDIVVVKTGRTEFAVLDRSLMTEDVPVGAKVHVEPYARRRFDGQRADTPVVEDLRTVNGQLFTSATLMVGQAPAPLPIPVPKCPELRDMVEQLETLPAPDGFRCISHMLVDAGAREFKWVDPAPEEIIQMPPSISFVVSTTKFQGSVMVVYERGLDLYRVELHQGGYLTFRADELCLDQLGNALEDLIDDGSWRRIRVVQVKTGKVGRH